LLRSCRAAERRPHRGAEEHRRTERRWIGEWRSQNASPRSGIATADEEDMDRGGGRTSSPRSGRATAVEEDMDRGRVGRTRRGAAARGRRTGVKEVAGSRPASPTRRKAKTFWKGVLIFAKGFDEPLLFVHRVITPPPSVARGLPPPISTSSSPSP
jgi:hypothetical protein